MTRLISTANVPNAVLDLLYGERSTRLPKFVRRSTSDAFSNTDPKYVILVFEEPSTRTHKSFEVAARAEGYEVLSVGAGSSLLKGESMIDTIENLISIVGAPNVAAVVTRTRLREDRTELLTRLAGVYPQIFFLNAGDSDGHHPTQALGDALALARAWDEEGTLTRDEIFAGKTVTIVGDVEASRVARSVYELFTRLGITVAFGQVAKQDIQTLYPGARIFTTLEQTLDQSDAIMCLRYQSNRMRPGTSELTRELMFPQWRIHARDLEPYPDLLLMHPGPVMWADRPEEDLVIETPGHGYRDGWLSHDLRDHDQCIVLDQARACADVRRMLLAMNHPDHMYNSLIQAWG